MHPACVYVPYANTQREMSEVMFRHTKFYETTAKRSSDGILSLVNAGARVDAEDKDGLTEMYIICLREGHKESLVLKLRNNSQLSMSFLFPVALIGKENHTKRVIGFNLQFCELVVGIGSVNVRK
ncbi:Cortactin-binding protein 2 [Orchesella cincta]|uniref:Cortactin-binding protein 2 n=1 Tax=Orchesella cincta TaxID=48709 RepID=A0A1D2N577_ORCCI|nr:Cortactin-binding protein 2 [Orchesella cincta]